MQHDVQAAEGHCCGRTKMCRHTAVQDKSNRMVVTLISRTLEVCMKCALSGHTVLKCVVIGSGSGSTTVLVSLSSSVWRC